MKKKNRGFTLIELMSVIIVLSLILSLCVYGVSVVIKNAKENTYTSNINNIEKMAESYLIENDNKLVYAYDDDRDVEYQCVTVGNLIEQGYFKNDILDSFINDTDNVALDHYIYVERDVNTGSIVNSKYVLNEEDKVKCDNAVETVVRTFININPVEWSLDKEITITYKLKNYYNVDNYTFEFKYEKNDYSYEDEPKYEVISDNGNVKKIKVYDNGKITGYIVDNITKEEIIGSSKDVTTIDKTKPIVLIDKEFDSEKLINRDLKITIEDKQSGLKIGGNLEYGWSDSDIVEPTYETAKLDYENGDKKTIYTISKTGLMGKYYLWIKIKMSDMLDNTLEYDNIYGGYEFIYQFEVRIEGDLGISSVYGAGMYVVGSKVSVSTVVKEFYKFSGWTGFTSSNNLTFTFIMPEYDVVLKANSLKYKCSVGSLVNDKNKGYICVDNSSSSRSSYNCNCVSGSYCTNYVPSYSCRVCYCNCMSGAEFCGCCGLSTCGGYCSSYDSYTTCSKCYSCKSGWNSYSGSGSSLKCYRNATN